MRHCGAVGIGDCSRQIRGRLSILRARWRTHEQHADNDQEMSYYAANFSLS
jgi:hypothetical protein